MDKKFDFQFRVWYRDGEWEDLLVWYEGLDTSTPTTRSRTEWAYEALSGFLSGIEPDYVGVHDDGLWQVYGEAKLSGGYDYWGEYDEEVTIGFTVAAKDHDGFVNKGINHD